MIRQAVLKDLPLLMRLRMTVLKEVFNMTEKANMDELKKANMEYYKNALTDGTHIACFLEENEKIIGCGGLCLHSEMPSPDNVNGKCAYLMNVFVLPEYRGQKHGKEIIKWLIQKAREQNASKIYLESTECGRVVYEKLGFISLPDLMILRG